MDRYDFPTNAFVETYYAVHIVSKGRSRVLPASVVGFVTYWVFSLCSSKYTVLDNNCDLRFW